MKIKKAAKTLMVVLAAALVALMAIVLTSCGAPAKTLTGQYSKHTYVNFNYGVDWKQVTSYELQTYSDNTYVLTHKVDYFGSEDQEGRGLMITVSTGTFTFVASEDGDPAHLDLVLSKADTVIRNESGKMASATGQKVGAFTLYSNNWTAKSTEFFKSYVGEEAATFTTDDEAKETFIAKFGMGYKVTVQDPALDPDNPGLFASIVSIEVAE